jgi:hypothetical protein
MPFETSRVVYPEVPRGGAPQDEGETVPAGKGNNKGNYVVETTSG